MARDDLIAVALVLAFALLVTAHATIVAGLASRPPRWRGLAALVAAPLAPYWGYRQGMRLRAALWMTSAAAYAVLRTLAAH